MSFSLALTANQINVPIGEQTRTYKSQLPDRSMAKEMVRQTSGMPVAISAEVGEPPISAWQYQYFVVYFEQKWVLHAVVKHPQIKQTK
jgi:hypothetical protein